MNLNAWMFKSWNFQDEDSVLQDADKQRDSKFHDQDQLW